MNTKKNEMTKIVLLAEDDADDKLIFSEFFNEICKNTLKLLSVEDGMEAIRVLKKLPDDTLPSLIILDLNMPRMNGRDTLTYLKSTDRYKEIPVIIYSTHYDKSLSQEFEKMGATLVMAKPDSYDGFKKMIQIFLKTSLLMPQN